MGLFDLFKKKPVQQNSAQLSNEEKYGKAWLMIVGQNRQQGLQLMRELDVAGFIEASIALAMFTVKFFVPVNSPSKPLILMTTARESVSPENVRRPLAGEITS